MLFKFSTFTSALATGAVSLAIALAPGAWAQPTDECQDGGTVTVCESPGNAAISAQPPDLGGGGGVGANGGFGNGPYGPSGSLPPVGGNGAGR